MPSSRLVKGDGNRSAHSSRTMRNCRPRALWIGRIFTASSRSRLVSGQQHRPSEAVQPVTERRHSRIRTASGIEHGDVAGLHTLASSADLQAAAQPGLDQRRSVMHLARRVVEPDQPGLGPGADGSVRLDRQGEHALHAASGRRSDRLRSAKDLGGVAVVAIEIELPVDHAAAGMNAGIGPREIPLPVKRSPRTASEVPSPMFGHPTVGGTVARHVADAGERKVIAEHKNPVGYRLVKQPPPCRRGLVLVPVITWLPLGMGEADERLRNGVADNQSLLTAGTDLDRYVRRCMAAAIHGGYSRHDLRAWLDWRCPVGDQLEGGLRAWDVSAEAFRERALTLWIAPEFPLRLRITYRAFGKCIVPALVSAKPPRWSRCAWVRTTRSTEVGSTPAPWRASVASHAICGRLANADPAMSAGSPPAAVTKQDRRNAGGARTTCQHA